MPGATANELTGPERRLRWALRLFCVLFWAESTIYGTRVRVFFDRASALEAAGLDASGEPADAPP